MLKFINNADIQKHIAMINTVFIQDTTIKANLFSEKIKKCCPSLVAKAKANSIKEAQKLFVDYRFDLIVLFIEGLSLKNFKRSLHALKVESEIIYFSKSSTSAFDALQSCAAEYVIWPVNDDVLIKAVENVSQRLKAKEEEKSQKLLLKNLLHERRSNQSIGVPTIEGFTFFSIDEIIRCEGLQKCTRIITTSKTDIISSYNIGEFRKLLEPYGFFATHKSHLINLDFVKQYNREGSIILKNNSRVPVAKRRKSAFLNQVIHL